MRSLVHPAIDALKRLIDADDFPATRYVLDYAGFKSVDKVSSDSEIVITIRREDQPIILEHAANRLTSGNGRTHD